MIYIYIYIIHIWYIHIYEYIYTCLKTLYMRQKRPAEVGRPWLFFLKALQRSEQKHACAYSTQLPYQVIPVFLKQKKRFFFGEKEWGTFRVKQPSLPFVFLNQYYWKSLQKHAQTDLGFRVNKNSFFIFERKRERLGFRGK